MEKPYITAIQFLIGSTNIALSFKDGDWRASFNIKGKTSEEVDEISKGIERMKKFVRGFK